jgi:four helix bundle protein
MRRAAVSIPSNIAEGQARRTTGEFVQFISHAEGSLAEVETQLLVSLELRYLKEVDVDEFLSSVNELRKMLNPLRRKLLKRSG